MFTKLYIFRIEKVVRGYNTFKKSKDCTYLALLDYDI